MVWRGQSKAARDKAGRRMENAFRTIEVPSDQIFRLNPTTLSDSFRSDPTTQSDETTKPVAIAAPAAALAAAGRRLPASRGRVPDSTTRTAENRLRAETAPVIFGFRDFREFPTPTPYYFTTAVPIAPNTPRCMYFLCSLLRFTPQKPLIICSIAEIAEDCGKHGIFARFIAETIAEIRGVVEVTTAGSFRDASRDVA